MFLLEVCSRITQYAINAADNTQQQDTRYASNQAETHRTTVLERWNRLFVRGNEHSLDNQQVVVQRNDGVDQSDEHNQVVTAVEGGCKDKELAEEACERWNTCQ